jgi:hypothetical protein
MNIFLRLLMEETKELWQGVDAYDSNLKCRFNLHVAYLWSIHDYLAYDKFSGWCVHGRLNYPICMYDTNAFSLEHSKKVSFFDYHRIFLPSNHSSRSDTWSFLKGNVDAAERPITISFYSYTIFVIFILNSIFCRTDIQRS